MKSLGLNTVCCFKVESELNDIQAPDNLRLGELHRSRAAGQLGTRLRGSKYICATGLGLDYMGVLCKMLDSEVKFHFYRNP